MFKPILLALMLITAGCSNNKSESKIKEMQPQVTETNQTQLQLNNGQKWQLDEATRQNMKEMKAYISQATHATGGLSGDVLQKHVQALKNNSNAESASHAVNEDVKAFDTYFE